MSEKFGLSRRESLIGLSAIGATMFCGGDANGNPPGGAEPSNTSRGIREKIFAKVRETPFIDTHEHLCDEADRLSGNDPFGGVDDWTVALAHYLISDLLTAGMPQDALDKFFESAAAPREKWSLLEPYWPAVKNTGYARAARISIRELYGVDEISADTVERIQEGYVKLRRKGFYRRIFEMAKIESCQVNSTNRPFNESSTPTLLMQDLSIVGMFDGPQIERYGEPAGIDARRLEDWHRAIDWWFDKYGKFAVAAKSQNAYGRDIDYERIPAENVEKTFAKKAAGEPVADDQRKALEDHLFWHAVQKATECGLPIKLHTGYYCGENYMPLARLRRNAGSACELCKASPDSRFVFMHICYPYYEEMIAVAKHYANAYIDMCWSWIINPVAAKDFLKKYLVTAPANKILAFGGDYLYVEPVLGHASMARHGIALALSELVEEQWLDLDDALELIDSIMHNNARKIFRLEEKQKLLETAPWLGQ
jgi:predicted TIM-barrel fold metal-dependent hydrolase